MSVSKSQLIRLIGQESLHERLADLVFEAALAMGYNARESRTVAARLRNRLDGAKQKPEASRAAAKMVEVLTDVVRSEHFRAAVYAYWRDRWRGQTLTLLSAREDASRTSLES